MDSCIICKKNLVSSFNPSVLHVNVVYDLPVCLAAMQAGRGESQPENAKGNGHFSRNPSSPYDAIPTLVIISEVYCTISVVDIK